MKTTVGLVQMRCTDDAKKNQAAAAAGIREAAKRGARIVCLPELYLGHYFCQSEDHAQFARAEAIPGPSTKALGALAKSLKVVIVGSLFERRAAGLYHNTAVTLDADGKLVDVYRKMHIPDDPLYYEKFYFTPGDLGFKAVDTKHGRVGTLVCWDQWYPEGARLTALQGANVLFYPTAIGWHPSEKKEWGKTQVAAWQTMQRSHAIANGLYVVAVNRTGHEGDRKAGIEFFGSSFIVDPYGRVLAEASHDKPEVLVAEVDTAMVETARQHWPFLRDRRIDAYGGITKRHLEKPVSASLASRGYAMPAEWAPHAATWIGWPHEVKDWPGRFSPIPWAYGELVRLIRHERVRILVGDAAMERKACSVLTRVGVDLGRLDFHRIPTDRVWTRDSGAIFVTDRRGKRVATHWRFNGWAKYANHKRDDAVAGRIAKALGVPEHRVIEGSREVVMEGGAIDVDGEGLLLATEECLLSDVQARNPGLGLAGTEDVLRKNLGIKRVVWLGRGIAGDDTHGHIDDLARFVGPGRVLLCREADEGDENFAALKENRERLLAERLDVIDLPMPAPMSFDGQRLPASYANFYITNGSVIVPTFNDPKDRVALGILADCFPGREVVGFHAVDFVWGLGTVHCATQQEPSGAPD